jgi:hypothetical protein
MQTVIGLGQAGCNIADKLGSYPQYDILKIDTGAVGSDNILSIPSCDSSEEYEEKEYPELIPFLGTPGSETLFITSCGSISGASLRILEKLKEKSKITMMYIIPDRSNLTDLQKLQNNLLFNVFQEYARSSTFERIILIDNKKATEIMGAVPVLKFWDTLNTMIASTYHMINVFDHSHPVFTTFSNKVNTARITTIGATPWTPETEKEENMFFLLDIPREKRYYYAVPQKMLEEDETLMTKIQKQVKIAVEHDRMKVGYAIYSTTYDHPYVYCEGYSTLIQKNPAS